MKRMILRAVVLCCAAAVLFVACKGSSKTSSDPNYPIEISIYHETGNHPQPAEDNPIYSYLKEKLNVTFSWDILVGDYRQKQGVMIAGGEYPDMLELRGNEWIDAGALIPLEDLIDRYAPRIRNLFKDYWEQMKSADGHTYYMLNYGVYQGPNPSPNYDQAAFWIQKGILKEAGYPKIKTIDQYFDLIADYYKKNPTFNGQSTIPFTILTDDWRAFELWNPPNFLAGYPNEGNGVVDPVTHKYTVFFTMDISKRWFKKLNELNAQGLIDRTSFTDNYDQYSAKVASGRVLGMSIQGWQIGGAQNSNRAANGNWRTMVPLPIVWDENTTSHYRNRDIPNLLRGGGISVSAKDPIRIIRFINDWLDEEVQRVYAWGVEGKDWQYNAQGIPYRTDAQRTNWRDQNYQETNRALLMGDIFPKHLGYFSDGYPSDLSLYYPEREANLLPEDKEVYAAYGVTGTNELMDKNPPPNSVWFPSWSLPTPPDGSAANLAIVRMEQIMKQRLPQMILAPVANFERLWTEYVAEMNAAGIPAYEAYYQAGIDQRIRDWSPK